MKDLTKGKPKKLLLEFALPVFLANICQLFYSLVDSRIVGQTLGDNSLAAIYATNSVSSLIVGFLLGLASGFAILVARYFGANDEKELRRSTAGAILLGVITALILTILSVTFLRPLLHVLNTPDTVMGEAYDYIRIILLGMVITMAYNVLAGILRAIGDTMAPLFFLIISTILNIFLDYFFIINLNMGVKGAAQATIICQAVSVILCIVYIWRKYPMLHLKREDFRMDLNLVEKLYSTGISMGFMLSIVYLGTLALQGAINTFSDETIVAHGAARKITEIFMLSFSVFGTTMATYASQNYGAGEIKRIKEGVRTVTIYTWIWSLGAMIASYTIAPQLVRLVTATENQEIIQTATLYLRIDTLFYFVPALITIIRNTMQGIGDHTTPIYSSLIELIGKVLIAFLLAPKIKYMGIILAEPIVWILMVIPLIVKYLSNPVMKSEKLLQYGK
ncbi:MAG: MATE family efflux transporter [bacterium]|nr:MATE family efflux transporter [bacterium]